MEVPEAPHKARGFPFLWQQQTMLAQPGPVIARRASVIGDRSPIIALRASVNGAR